MLDDALILPNIIADRAESDPNRVFLTDIGHAPQTYADLNRKANAYAAAFQREGVAYGDRVLTMSPPRADWFCAWIGLARLGAIDVGVNIGFRGRMLDYNLTKPRSRIILLTAALAELLTPELIQAAGIELVIVTAADAAPQIAGARCVTEAEFLDGVTAPDNPIRPQVWDTSCIVLTSGTTGPSKLVQVPWGTMHSGGSMILPLDGITPDDVWYQPLPTFHLAAKFGINLMALANGSVVQREAFSLSAFWQDVREYGCTVANISPLTRFLNSVPEQPGDADNPLRAVVANPQPPDPQDMCRRFGFTLSASYGCSELGIPISAGWNPENALTCGRVRTGWPGVELRIVDEHDEDVPVGEIGEVVVRTREPWALTSGYFDNPEATAAAWRNGWFHIGDAMRQDEDGNLYFHDRVKDSIRRRGENISSFEVEAEVNSHPAVAESAAVAVKMPAEEDELKVFVVVAEGEKLTPEELCEYMAGRVARFMVPRFVEFVDELPKTEATLRIKKTELRNRGNSAATWDREAAQIKI